MKGWMPAVGVAIAVALAAGIWLAAGRGAPIEPPHPDAHRATTAVPATPRPRNLTTAPPTPTAKAAAPDRAGGPSLANHLSAADDYLAFAESVLPAATAGDRDAQFYLAEVLRTCDMGYRVYFDRRGQARRTLEEAQLRVAGRTKWEGEDLQWVHERCHRLKDQKLDRFGTAQHWLRLATDARHPVALAREAARIHGEIASLQANLPYDAPLTPENTKRLKRVRELLLDALRSRDPAALLEVGYLSHLFAPEASMGVRAQAWSVVACERGLDCSAGASWVRWGCLFDLNCPGGENGIELLQRISANEWPEIERLAHELDARIDAGEWEKALDGSD